MAEEHLTEAQMEAAAKVRSQAKAFENAVARGASITICEGFALQLDAETRDFLSAVSPAKSGGDKSAAKPDAKPDLDKSVEEDPLVVAMANRRKQIDDLVIAFHDYLIDKEREDLNRDRAGGALLGLMKTTSGFVNAFGKRLDAMEERMEALESRDE